MAVAMRPAPFDLQAGSAGVAEFVRWLRTHPTAIVVAYLLGFAYPLTSLASALGVVPSCRRAWCRGAFSGRWPRAP